jgi:hypothetical protein
MNLAWKWAKLLIRLDTRIGLRIEWEECQAIYFHCVDIQWWD